MIAARRRRNHRMVGEFMRLDGAALREGLRIEIDDHRAFLQRVLQREGEVHAADSRGGGEVGREIARA